VNETFFEWVLVVVIFVTYYNCLFGAFIWDDRAAIVSDYTFYHGFH
jgi:hypothetical protein